MVNKALSKACVRRCTHVACAAEVAQAQQRVARGREVEEDVRRLYVPEYIIVACGEHDTTLYVRVGVRRQLNTHLDKTIWSYGPRRQDAPVVEASCMHACNEVDELPNEATAHVVRR